MDKLERALIKSLALAKRKKQELSSELIVKRLISSEAWSKDDILKKWKKMGFEKKTKVNNDYFGKLLVARKVAERLLKIKWIKMIAVTGSVAMKNSSSEDDIDFLIITQNKRLWITRAGVILLMMMGRIDFRRTGNPKRANQICFNLWLENRSLEVPTDKRTLQAAMDAINMTVVGGDKNYYRKFLEHNKWIGKYLASAYHEETRAGKSVETDWDRGSVWGDWANKLAYGLQRQYMAPKITKEKVSESWAYFHPKVF